MKNLALMLTRPPFSDSKGHDALDMAMVLGSFEIPTALFFVSAGVNQLRTLTPELYNIKNYTKSFSALPFYDVEDLYVCREDLIHWNISQDSLTQEFTVLCRTEIQGKLANFNRIVRF